MVQAHNFTIHEAEAGESRILVQQTEYKANLSNLLCSSESGRKSISAHLVPRVYFKDKWVN